jgi:alpha-ribazole phosphatase
MKPAIVDARDSSIRLRLIRHPKPDIEVGLCYGRLDVPPDESDLDRLVGELLQSPAPELVYSSPLQRCQRTALAMHLRGWPAPALDARVAEMNFGDWEGQRWDDIGREEIERWRLHIADHVPPGGESVRTVAERALAFARDVLTRHRTPGTPGSLDIVVFTHAGIIQTLPRIWRGELLAGFAGTRVEYGSTTELILE